jgi:hypothetical protein
VRRILNQKWTQAEAKVKKYIRNREIGRQTNKSKAPGQNRSGIFVIYRKRPKHKNRLKIIKQQSTNLTQSRSSQKVDHLPLNPTQ